MNNLRQSWENASPKSKRIVMGAAAIGVFVLFGSFVHLLDRAKERPKATKTSTDTTVMLPSRRDTNLESVSASTVSLGRRMQQLESDRKTDVAGVQEQLKQLQERIGTQSHDEDLMRQVAALSVQVNQLSKQLDQPVTRPTQPDKTPLNKRLPLPPLDNIAGPRSAQPGAPTGDPLADGAGKPALTPTVDKPSPTATAEPATTLRVIGGEMAAAQDGVQPGNLSGIKPSLATASSSPSAAPTNKSKDNDTVFLPAGSMIQGVLLNGLDAPTSGAAQKNPTPVLIRVKHDAVLPNRFRMDIQECFIIAGGHGSMSSERAILRTEAISCVREDGGVVETKISGYAIGEDGKVGLRGRLISKQGSMLARSLVSGFFGGLGQAIKPMGVTGLNLSPTGTAVTQSYDLGTAFEAGALGGVSTSLNQVAKFYLDIAKEMVPVVEVDAGRSVTVVLVQGGSLRFKKG